MNKHLKNSSKLKNLLYNRVTSYEKNPTMDSNNFNNYSYHLGYPKVVTL